MLISTEIRGIYDDNMVPYTVLNPQSLKKNVMKIKEIIMNILTCMEILVN